MDNLDTDWISHFLPAIERLLHWGNPYADIYVLNPPWTFILLAPVGILPHDVAKIIGWFLPVLALIYASWKVRKLYLIAIVGLTIPFIDLVFFGNLDWMVLLGTLSINWLTPFLLTVKPQAGALAVVGQLGQLKGKPFKDYVRVFAPFVVGAPLLILAFPGFINNYVLVSHRLSNVTNFALFPYSVPFAIPLLWLAYRRKQPVYGALASLCISPYFYFHSIVPSMFLIAERNWKWGVVVSILTWVFFYLILRAFIAIYG